MKNIEELKQEVSELKENEDCLLMQIEELKLDREIMDLAFDYVCSEIEDNPDFANIRLKAVTFAENTINGEENED